MAITPFAKVSDYEDRYGEVENPTQILTLLTDATAFISEYPGFNMLDSTSDGYDLQQANLKRVCCSVVRRALSAGPWTGLSNVSQGADGYNASLSVANPTEDFYLTSQERKALGISGSVIGTVYAAIHGPCGGVIWP